MIKLIWEKKELPFEQIEWSGTSTQCSRQITFTVPSNPYDKDVSSFAIELGAVVSMYSDKKLLFVGTVTQREKTAEIGTASYTAMDFMHHLLRSNATYSFKKKTPEKIAAKVCKDLEIQTTALAKTKASIAKLIVEDQPVYDIIVAAYRRAKATTGKIYMPIMSGKKVSVIVKGQESGVTMTQGSNITGATYTDTTDNMVDAVAIYNGKRKKVGYVKNNDNASKYGVYQEAYTKEKGVDAKKKAKSMFVGITKESTMEAIGDIRAISGYSIKINDAATGLSGKFYITSDTHTFADGVHTMSLELAWKNEAEEGAETVSAKKSKETKKAITNAAKCFYTESGSVYHSRRGCSSISGKKTKQSTVAEMKKIKIKKGSNKGKRKYKACSKCWKT